MWRLWLSIWGFQVCEAANGQAATEAAFAQPPRVVLMDLSMPVMDGLTAVRRLRADPRTARTTVIGVTAHGSTHPAVGSFRAECDLLLEKPVEPHILLENLRLVLKHAS
jgi:CheY-like chemotaxis protein